MEPDEMRRIDNEVRDAVNAGDLEAFDRLMGPELAQEFKEGIPQLKKAFPDYGGDNELQVVEGDYLVTRWVYFGTHEGDYFGVPPTGKKVKFTGISLNRFADGKMVESTIEADDLSVLHQIGATAVPPEKN